MRQGAMGVLGVWMAACVLVLSAGAWNFAAGKTVGAPAGEPLVICFGNGQKDLDAAGRGAIQRLLSHQKPGPGSKLLVLGHSDGRGDPKQNMRLSQQRAEAVRKEILRAAGVDAQFVLAVGRGSDNPLGDNRQPEGRARNRRVEIYGAQALDSHGRTITANPPAVSPQVAAMVQDARTLIRRRQLIEAVRLLEAARTQGGEGDSHWHAVYGIAGFYAGTDLPTAKRHLSLSLDQDPFNQEARDYLGRITARERVAAGTVNGEMGQHEQAPIAVSSDAEAYEYLQLFGVQPLSKQKLPSRSVEAWQCRDREGRQVVYYFDRSRVYAWAFARRAEELSSAEPRIAQHLKGK